MVELALELQGLQLGLRLELRRLRALLATRAALRIHADIVTHERRVEHAVEALGATRTPR